MANSNQPIEVDVGIDASTAIVGVCVLEHHTGVLVDLFPIKLTSSKLEDIWDKAAEFQRIFQQACKPEWVVKRIFVEDVAKKFSPGFSSAQTIVVLAKMNALVCWTAMNSIASSPKPIFINVRSARKVLGIKINTKDKTLTTKEKVLAAVIGLQPTFPWLQHVAKTGKHTGSLVYDKCNEDMADAYVCCRGGQLLPV